MRLAVDDLARAGVARAARRRRRCRRHRPAATASASPLRLGRTAASPQARFGVHAAARPPPRPRPGAPTQAEGASAARRRRRSASRDCLAEREIPRAERASAPRWPSTPSHAALADALAALPRPLPGRRAHGRRHVGRRRLRGGAAAHRAIAATTPSASPCGSGSTRTRPTPRAPAARPTPCAGRAPPATRSASRTSRSTRATASARSWSQPFVDDYQAGRDAEPVHHLQRRLPHRRCSPTRPHGSGADRLATGHYARLVPHGDGALVAPGRRPRQGPVRDARTRAARRCSARLAFPLADAHKQDVRARGRGAGLAAATAPREPGRLLPRRRRPARLPRSPWRRPAARRDPSDADGAVLGRHEGAVAFTIGQRRGLGVAAAEPQYVRSVDAAAGHRHDRAAAPARPARGRADRRHAAPPGLAGARAPARAHGRRGGDGRDVARGTAACASTSRSSRSRRVRSRCCTTTRASSSAPARSLRRAGRCRA